MHSVLLCRHYDVKWLDSHTCYCRDCGKQGQFTEQGFAIWIRTQPKKDPRSSLRRDQARSKVA